MSEDSPRIDGLEVRVAHQEKMIGELNEVVTAQWKKLAALERLLAQLGEELQSMDQGQTPNERPPHY